jgi:hypothetical protein
MSQYSKLCVGKLGSLMLTDDCGNLAVSYWSHCGPGVECKPINEKLKVPGFATHPQQNVLTDNNCISLLSEHSTSTDSFRSRFISFNNLILGSIS